MAKDKLIFEGLEGDKGARFGRWLVHEIGVYYGLNTWSITVDGEPPRREAYVGLASTSLAGLGARNELDLPRPLWGMV